MIPACLPRPDLPPPRAPEQPQRHEQAWVAEGAAGSLILERLGDGPATLWLLPPKGPAREAAHGVGWPTGPRSGWTVALPENEALAPTRATPGPPNLTDHVQLLLTDDTVVLTGPRGTSEPLRTLAQSPDEVWWIADAQGRPLGLEATYDGQPQVQAVYKLDTAAGLARLWSRLGYEAHLAQDYALALQDWTRSWEADPSPQRGDVLYNLACASARLGQVQPALRHLAAALAADPKRFAALAADDPDLATLAGHEDFERLVRLYTQNAAPGP